MKATLLLGLAFDWTTEADYASHLTETLERMRQSAFVDTTLPRFLSDGKAHVQILATFDYEDEYDYASKLVEVVDYAREYASAELRAVKRGTGIAAEGHLNVRTGTVEGLVVSGATP